MEIVLHVINLAVKGHAAELHAEQAGSERLLVEQHLTKDDLAVTGRCDVRDLIGIAVGGHDARRAKALAHVRGVEVIDRAQGVVALLGRDGGSAAFVALGALDHALGVVLLVAHGDLILVLVDIHGRLLVGRAAHGEDEHQHGNVALGGAGLASQHQHDRHAQRGHGDREECQTRAHEIELRQRGDARDREQQEVLSAVAQQDDDGRENAHDRALRIAERVPAENAHIAGLIGCRGGVCEHAHDDRGRDDPEVEHQAGLKRAVALFVRTQKRDEAQHKQRHLHDADEVGQIVDDALIADDEAGNAVSDEQQTAGDDSDAIDLLARRGEEAEQAHGGKNNKAEQQRDRVGHAKAVRPVRQDIQQRLQNQQDEQDRGQRGRKTVTQGVFFFGHISSPLSRRNLGYRLGTRWPPESGRDKKMHLGGAVRRRCYKCGRGRCTAQRRRRRPRP